MRRARLMRTVFASVAAVGLAACLGAAALGIGKLAGPSPVAVWGTLVAPLFFGMLLLSVPRRRPPIGPVLLGMVAFLAAVLLAWDVGDSWSFIQRGADQLCPVGLGQPRLLFWSAVYAAAGGGLLLPLTVRRGAGWRAFGWWSGAFLVALVTAVIAGSNASEDWYSTEKVWSLLPPPWYALVGAASASVAMLACWYVADGARGRSKRVPAGPEAADP